MKSILNSNFKNSLSLNFNRKFFKFPLKQVRSAEGIRNQIVAGNRIEIVNLKFKTNNKIYLFINYPLSRKMS